MSLLCDKLYDPQLRRSVFGFHVSQDQDVDEYISRGYTVYEREGRQLCRAPERNVLDISNIDLPYDFDRTFPIRAWQYLMAKGEDHTLGEANRIGVRATIIKDSNRECQFRISSEDRTSLERLYNHMVFEVLRPLVNKSAPCKRSPGLFPNVPKELFPGTLRTRIKGLVTAYHDYARPDSSLMMRLRETGYVYSHEVWRDVARLGLSPLFVLFDGLEFGLGFELTTQYPATFLEYHHGGDPYQHERSIALDDLVWLDIPPKGGDCVIIDRSLTGTSLTSLRKAISPKAVIALTPKSRSAIRGVEYAIFHGRLINTADISSCDDWYLDLYSRISEGFN